MLNRSLFVTAFFLNTLIAFCQLSPGFNRQEYVDLMKVSAQFGDSGYAAKLPPPEGYKILYRSPVMGLDNRWDLWRTSNGIPVISIRGTTAKEISWTANFYAAMVPASGEMQLSSSEKFQYKLAESERAAVHVGWLTCTGFLVKDMLPKIDSCYKAGNRAIYIVGHSQGGAIAFLLNAYLHSLQKQNILPADLQIKTYCSAAPKPGNLYFAFEYEAMTQQGWAFNVVNAADWVPQTPFSVQTVDDFATINPFTGAKGFIKKQGWPKRWALNYAYGRMTTPSRKARKNYKKFLGNFVSKSIKKYLPGYQPPAYFNSNDYVRTGTTITLLPGADYFEKFPQDKSKVFANHFHAPYLFLAAQLPDIAK